ncbi:MAG: hypothetical protein M3Q29_15655 [Chloroflexota bacterium]|nr:hypothetical protein [Chloroflexota bacterium]
MTTDPLGQRVRGLVEAGALCVTAGFRTERLSPSPDGSVELRGEDGTVHQPTALIAQFLASAVHSRSHQGSPG